MPRPAKGDHARTVAIATKVTPAENEILIARYGSGYQALRAGVALLIADATAVPAHRHAAGERVGERYDQGTKVEIFTCSQDGCGKRIERMG